MNTVYLSKSNAGAFGVAANVQSQETGNGDSAAVSTVQQSTALVSNRPSSQRRPEVVSRPPVEEEVVDDPNTVYDVTFCSQGT